MLKFGLCGFDRANIRPRNPLCQEAAPNFPCFLETPVHNPLKIKARFFSMQKNSPFATNYCSFFVLLQDGCYRRAARQPDETEVERIF